MDEVLLVGGSTLLPEVPAVVDEAFPQAVVRHDNAFVFTAVASGAARFAGGVALDDFIYHDYALAVQNEQSHTVEYERLVPRRTRYPTASGQIVRYYADYPGMSEMRLRVCEIGRLGQSPVAWQRRAQRERLLGAPDRRGTGAGDGAQPRRRAPAAAARSVRGRRRACKSATPSTVTAGSA